MEGETLGSYRIVGKLGSGGMGVVYAAEHTLLGSKAAVKVLHPELTKEDDTVSRFFNEARAVTRIKHPGIVQVFDFGHHKDGRAYYVMELLEGESLHARLRREKRLPPDDAVAIAIQVAAALEAAHAQGVVHRDLKPDNIFLVPDAERGERTKVLDFGIAKLTGDAHAISLNTRTGSVMGTPFYMAPEQARGAADVDARADVYSLGCVLFELLCGRPPFSGTSMAEVLGAHLHVAPPSPRSLEPSIPPTLDALVLAMLAKQPDDRPQTMADVVAALSALPSGLAGTLPSQPPAAPRPTATAPPPAPAPPAPRELSSSQQEVALSTTLGSAAAQTRARGERRTWLRFAVPLALTGVALAAFMAIRSRRASHGRSQPVASPPDAALPAVVVDAGPAAPENAWIRIDPPASPIVLGIAAAKAPSTVTGFRPRRHVTSPSIAYELQQHEVTWGELEPWLAADPTRAFPRPSWLPPAAAERRMLPATNVPWATAYGYCRSLEASLPSEEQWELAARGAALRPWAWGDARLDLARTHAFAGPGAHAVAVMTSEQDRTPDGIFDLMGNAEEWTADLWREDLPDQDESWVQAQGIAYRAIRGLPLAEPPPPELPVEGAAARRTLCASGACLVKAAAALEAVGFRCARPAGLR